MARIERKVAGLIMRDAGIVESIRIVLEKSEDGGVELDWADVRGELDGCQCWMAFKSPIQICLCHRY